MGEKKSKDKLNQQDRGFDELSKYKLGFSIDGLLNRCVCTNTCIKMVRGRPEHDISRYCCHTQISAIFSHIVVYICCIYDWISPENIVGLIYDMT